MAAMSSRLILASRSAPQRLLLTQSVLSGSKATAASNASPASQRQYNNNRGRNSGNNGRDPKWGVAAAAAAAGLAGVYVNVMEDKMTLKAEVDASEKEVVDMEDRIRTFGAMKDIFDYFSSYQFKDSKGRETTLMSVKDFYNCITPGSTITHGTGLGTYTRLRGDDARSQKIYDEEKLPISESLLNEIQRQGLLTFEDFAFLLNILSTPWRHMDVAFHSFDISADGKIEAREYTRVMSKFSDYRRKPDELMAESNSGLMNYFFGKNRDRFITKEQWNRFQRDLIADVLYMEFRRYPTLGGKGKGDNISELDFCHHILYNANVTGKRKTKMLRRVEKAFKNGPGISFPDFKNFCYILYGGADLERAIMFRHGETNGVTREEFHKMALWVANKNISKHVLEVVFTLLDDDSDELLSVKEFQPVLFQWRHHRGFHRSSFHVPHNQLKG